MPKRIVTLNDLKNDPGLAPVIEDLTRRFNGQLPTSVIDTMIDIVSWADIHPRQVAQWINDASSIADRILANQANTSDYSICWIRLFEIINVLPTYFSRYEKLYPELNKISDPLMKTHIELGESIRKHMLALESCLTEEEIIASEYERNCNAHIFQSGYKIKVKITPDDKISGSKTEFKGKSIKDVNAIIDRQLSLHNYLDAEFLRSILSKITPHLKQIASLINHWSL